MIKYGVKVPLILNVLLSTVDGRGSPMESWLVWRCKIVCITLSCLQTTNFSLFRRERYLRFFTQTLDISVLRFDSVIIRWHKVAWCCSKTCRWPEFVLWFFISPWRVHAKRHAGLSHSICISTHVQLLNRPILWEGSLVEGTCKLVNPYILLSVLASWDPLGDSKILFFDFVLILFQISFRVAGYLLEEWCSLMPLLFIARAIAVRICSVIKVLV